MTAGEARILIANSTSWRDVETAEDALNAAIEVAGAFRPKAVVVSSQEAGAAQILAGYARRSGLATESRSTVGDGQDAVRLVGLGADLCVAFPTHGYVLRPGQDPANTSRDAWNCAELAKRAGIPTVVVWAKQLYPFGDPAVVLLTNLAQRKSRHIGPQGQVSILDCWLRP